MDSKTETVSGKTDNELIAQFMGGKWETVWCAGVETKAFNFPGWHITDWPHVIREDTFKYDTSWDWLMPVVEKIEDMRCTKIGVDNEVQFNDVLNIPISAPMNNIYLCVVNFIRWFNSQSPATIKP